MSVDDRSLIDEIILFDPEKGNEYVVVTFKSEELLPFITYYANSLLKNMKVYRPTAEKPARARKNA